LLSQLSSAHRSRLRGRIVWITTASPYFAITGVRVGATLAAARQRLGLGRSVSTRAGVWYLASDGAATALIEVRGGVVGEIGISLPALTSMPAARKALIGSVA
jgi:hypothetical protein